MVAKATEGTAVVTLPSSTEVRITREFDAPKHLVYKAWTTPELITRWWSANRGQVTAADPAWRRDAGRDEPAGAGGDLAG
jgi:uncharacterized protein YndB with AHSA1/START domain